MKLNYNLDFIQDKNKKSQIKKAISILERAFYSGKEYQSFFLDPYEQEIVKSISNKNNIEINFIGGNKNSERKIFIANYNSFTKIDSYIQVLEFKHNKLKHPDVLGALINLGLERQDIGDIVIKDNICEFVLLEKDKAFVKYNLSKIKNESISVNYKKENTLSDNTISFTKKKGFVSSLRLDNIVSELINTSRKKSKNMISSKFVKVDYVTITDPSKIIEEGSIISIKHEGRFIFDKITGLSKKGNYHIEYRKYT